MKLLTIAEGALHEVERHVVHQQQPHEFPRHGNKPVVCTRVDVNVGQLALGHIEQYLERIVCLRLLERRAALAALSIVDEPGCAVT